MKENKFGLLSITFFLIMSFTYFFPSYSPEQLTLLHRIIGVFPLFLNILGVAFGVIAINKEKIKLIAVAGFTLNSLIAFLWLSFFFSFGPGGYLLDYLDRLVKITFPFFSS